jgi:hypothetical protein
VTTVAQHAEMIRRRLFGGSLGRYNPLAAAITDTVGTTLTVTDSTTGIVQGTRIDVDSEIMLVRSVDQASKVVTVIRGFLGSTPAVHANGALVEIAPRFPLADIIDTMREEVETWKPHLFTVETASFGSSSFNRGYDLVGAVAPLFVLEVSGGDAWNRSQSYLAAEIIRDSDVASFPSGVAIQFKQAPASGVPLRVSWAEPIVTDNWAGTTDLETIGIQRSWFDILTYGVIGRMMIGKEIGRTDLHASGETRRAEEVPPGYNAKTADEFMHLRDMRLAHEALLLRGRYPYRVGT